MKQVHIILQGKGGVGKSLISSLMAQYFNEHQRSTLCIDTDPVNHTFAGYKELKVESIVLLQDKNINTRNFDSMIEHILKDDVEQIIIDSGASTFLPLASYLANNDIPHFLQESEISLNLHTVVTGSQGTADTINGMNSLVETFKNQANIYVWLNSYFGAIEIYGKKFLDLEVFQRNQEFITSVIEIPELDKDTFNFDLIELLREKKTFNEGINDPQITIMNRHRLTILKHKLFNLIEEAGL